MINQYFNVYALRHVRCAGYATAYYSRLSFVMCPEIRLYSGTKHPGKMIMFHAIMVNMLVISMYNIWMHLLCLLYRTLAYAKISGTLWCQTCAVRFGYVWGSSTPCLVTCYFRIVLYCAVMANQILLPCLSKLLCNYVNVINQMLDLVTKISMQYWLVLKRSNG